MNLSFFVSVEVFLFLFLVVLMILVDCLSLDLTVPQREKRSF